MKKMWIEKSRCSGCGACWNVCPAGAIVPKEDDLGFTYPKITNRCINCNLCEKTCYNRLNCYNENREKPEVYAAWSSNSQIRFKSTSGGIFYEIAKFILEQGGYIVGARYGDYKVEHAIAKNHDELIALLQSKYVQSDIGFIYKDIKKELDNGRPIAFCGTPCQVAAVKSFLGKKYTNFIAIDFICRGVNSPKAYRAWLYEIENLFKSKIDRVWFKYKKRGWKSSPRRVRLDFADGKNVVFEKEKNTYMTGYLGPNLYIRPSCSKCNFKGSHRTSDITLADFWGVEKKLDDDKGTSMVMVNSDVGKVVFEKISKNLNYYEKEYGQAIVANGCFTSSVSLNPNSEKFLRDLDYESFSVVLKKYYKPDRIDDFISHIRTIKNKVFDKRS